MEQIKLSMNEVQQEAIEILKQVSDICEKLNIEYFLAYGTLIGAIRHEGFIPWDDDIDIMMPRNDYDRLCEYFVQNDNLIGDLKWFSPETNKDYPYMIARISSMKYVIDTDNEKPSGLGLFIDVYPLDGMGDDLELAKKRKKKINRTISLCFLSTRLSFKKGYTRSKLKMLIKYPAFIYSHLMGRDYFFKKIKKQAQLMDYNSSKYVGCVVWGSDDGVRAIFPKEWVDKTVDWKFAEYQFKVPKEYDCILRQLYGDYMQLPPEEDRIAHHFYSAYLREN